MDKSGKTYSVRKSESPNVTWGKKAFNSVRPADHKQIFKVEGKTGLRIEVTPLRYHEDGSVKPNSGRSCFRYITRFDGKPINITLKSASGQILRWGENVHALIDVEDAFNAVRDKLRKGINPNQEARVTREAITLQELYESYCVHFKHRINAGEVRKSSFKAAESMWRNHIIDVLGRERAADYSDKSASSFAAELLVNNGYATHNKVIKLLKAVFNYGINVLKVLEVNPFKEVKLLSEPKRERRLTMTEFDRLREAMSHEDQIYQDVILVLILTGQRKSCVYSMEWSEINRDQAIWNIPTSKMKANKAHSVPLTPAVISILERRSNESRRGERFVFSSMHSKTGHIAEKSGKGSFWRRVTERAGLYSPIKSENLCVHDLRRSLASFNVERGVSLQTVSKLLGHSDIGITASTYAHLDVDSVRGDLEETERALMLDYTTMKLERLRDQILTLTRDERSKLFEMINEALL